MSPEDAGREKVGRKLTKRRRHPQQRASMDIPDRFQDGDDALDDVSAPKDKNAQYMGQSVFAMLAAAGSRADLRARFDEESASDEEEGQQAGEGSPTVAEPEMDKGSSESEVKTGKHRKKLSEHKLLRSLPRLRVKSSKASKPGSVEEMSTSQILTPQAPRDDHTTAQADAPVMSRMLQARAEMEASRRDSSPHTPVDGSAAPSPQLKSAATLAQRLMEIFDFEEPEEVISEYPCWLLQSVLLQGYMYITQKHICFYAYLPKRTNVIVKSGYLTKRGRQNPKYQRYWFTLKGDVLFYYPNPSDLYFPRGHIDLRYGISAVLSEHKEKGKEATSFSVTTDQRTYHFRADSAASAKEWVRQLQKVIFRSHNDGDSVKISLPLENVIDIEENQVIDFADTVKLRVIDNDETYAVDEYFFSFFAFGKDALKVLRIMVDDSGPAQTPDRDLSAARAGRSDQHLTVDVPDRSRSRSPMDASQGGETSPIIRENVRATLSPLLPSPGAKQSPRPSCDRSRSSFDATRRSFDVGRDSGRKSFDFARRSISTSRQSLSLSRREKSPLSPKAPDSTESFANSIDREAESSAAIQSIDDTNASASQILNRSDVFQSPTIRHHQRATTGGLGGPEDATRDNDRSDHIPSQSTSTPTRTEASTEKPSQTQKGEEQNRDRPLGHDGRSTSSAALQDLVQAGSNRASGLATYLKSGSKRMSNLLSSGPMGYYEKVSGMWAGGTKHYGNPEALIPDDQVQGPEDEEDAATHGERFRAHFALPASEKLQATYFGWLYRVLPLYGKIYISNRKFCFRSLLPGTRTKLVLPIKDIETVSKEKGFRLSYSGLVVVVRGHEELFFEFNQSGFRDDCAVTLLQIIESAKYLEGSALLGEDEAQEAEMAKAEHQLLQEARLDSHAEHDIKMPRSVNETEPDAPPVLFDDPRASIICFKPTESMRITCLTIGSRGDVQPYIALCKGFLAEGHRPKIATHAEFEPWIRKHGIDFAPVEGDPAELMRLCVENGIMTFSFLKEAGAKFRGWLDELLSSAWKACQGSDILIESPSAMAGNHIAEALAIPYFRAFTMPWTRTRAYPHAFAVPDHKMGGAYNYFTYVMFETVFWKLMAGQVNRWRRKELGLSNTSLYKMQAGKIPFLYNFSPSVVIPPLDYSDWVRVTGYWFLDEGSGWEPPEDLLNFIKKAREDNKKIVYIGFGSIVVADPAALTSSLIESVLKADVRCILSKGWSDRMDKKDATVPEVPLPEEIFQIKSAPHDWLFRQIDVAVHHGGAGTTGASLRAGIPTIIKPFFGDQFFFGSRVEDLGVGICMKKVNTSVFARALWEATHSERMVVKARVLGEQIRKEDGVGNAIQAIYRDLEYAKSLIKRRDGQTEDLSDEFEESWTLIGEESDPELARRMADKEPGSHPGSARGRQRSGSPVLASIGVKGFSSVKGRGV